MFRKQSSPVPPVASSEDTLTMETTDENEPSLFNANTSDPYKTAIVILNKDSLGDTSVTFGGINIKSENDVSIILGAASFSLGYTMVNTDFISCSIDTEPSELHIMVKSDPESDYGVKFSFIDNNGYVVEHDKVVDILSIAGSSFGYELVKKEVAAASLLKIELGSLDDNNFGFNIQGENVDVSSDVNVADILKNLVESYGYKIIKSDYPIIDLNSTYRFLEISLGGDLANANSISASYKDHTGKVIDPVVDIDYIIDFLSTSLNFYGYEIDNT